MKQAGFLGLAGLVSFIASTYLPLAAGLQITISFISTISALAGGAIGMRAVSWKAPLLTVTLVIAVVLFVVSLSLYRHTIFGEPSEVAAVYLYFWTALMFLPVGYVIEVAGLKVSSP